MSPYSLSFGCCSFSFFVISSVFCCRRAQDNTAPIGNPLPPKKEKKVGDFVGYWGVNTFARDSLLSGWIGVIIAILFLFFFLFSFFFFFFFNFLFLYRRYVPFVPMPATLDKTIRHRLGTFQSQSRVSVNSTHEINLNGRAIHLSLSRWW